MTPDGKTFDPETVTDKQLVQYEQAIDRGLTEADAMRLTEHEYNGFQANAIIAAALNPAVGEDVLDALATPKYTAAQMTAIAKIAIRGGDFARFLDPQMDARRMEAAYLVVAHGGSDLPVERLSRSQLLTINNLLLQGILPYKTVRAIAKPAFTPESMEVIAAAMENARHDPYTGEHSLTEAQVARIMNPDYRPEQQIALLAAMRGQTPVADLSDADFAGLFPASLSVEQMSACAYAVNRCGYNTPLLMMTMQACADMNAQQLMAVFDATAAEFSDATMAKVSTILMHTPALTSQQMRYLLAEARDGTPFPALESMKDYLLAQVEPEKALVAETGVKSESRDMASGKEALAEQTGLDSTKKINQNKETAGDEYRIPLLKVLLREQLESRYEVANHFPTMNRARVELSAFIQNEGGAPLPEDALGTPEEQGIRAMLIATGEPPREVTLLPDKNGSTLKPLQALVGGNIETFDIAFGEEVSLYVNEEGLFTCPPNRAIFATEEMAKAGYLSQLDYSKVVEMGDFYTVLNGDIVAVGFDPETGESRSLTDGELSRVEGYFTVISEPGSGEKAVDAIRHGMEPCGYDISVETHDMASGRNALAADAPARDAPGKDDQNIG